MSIGFCNIFFQDKYRGDLMAVDQSVFQCTCELHKQKCSIRTHIQVCAFYICSVAVTKMFPFSLFCWVVNVLLLCMCFYLQTDRDCLCQCYIVRSGDCSGAQSYVGQGMLLETLMFSVVKSIYVQP